MELLKLAAFGAGVTAVIALSVWLSKKMDEKINSTSELKKETLFKTEFYSDVFTLQQTKEWISSKKDLICDKTKCAVFKLNSEMGPLYIKWEKFLADKSFNYLGIAIINIQSSEIVDSILIKYGTLDKELEEMLGAEGMLVITGGTKC